MHGHAKGFLKEKFHRSGSNPCTLKHSQHDIQHISVTTSPVALPYIKDPYRMELLEDRSSSQELR